MELVYVLTVEKRYAPIHTANIAHYGHSVVSVTKDYPKNLPRLDVWLKDPNTDYSYTEIRYSVTRASLQ